MTIDQVSIPLTKTVVEAVVCMCVSVMGSAPSRFMWNQIV